MLADVIAQTTPAETLPVNVELKTFDLGKLDEVKAFVAGWTHPVSALLLNAGYIGTNFETIGGIEKTFAVNHLGHAELFFGLHAKGLLSADARIVLTTSGMHDGEYARSPAPPQWTNTEFVATDPSITAITQYSNTKLANVLFANAISRRAETAYPGWAVITMDPGFVPAGGSKIFRDSDHYSPAALTIFSYIPWVLRLMGVGMSTTQRSGKALADLAVGDAHKAEKGAYYCVENKAESSAQSNDVALQEDLWAWTVAKLGAKVEL